MADTKEKIDEKDIKTKKVEIIKFHPLVAHDIGDEAALEEEMANKLIEMKYAKAVK